METNFNVHFKHTANNFPRVVIHDAGDEETLMRNFELDKEINYNNIIELATNYLVGKLKKDQAIEENESNIQKPEEEKNKDTKAGKTSEQETLQQIKELSDFSANLEKESTKALQNDYSLSLTEENFKKNVLESKKIVFVLVYKESNQVSEKVLNVFETLTNNIHEDSLLFAKLNAENQDILASGFNLGENIPNLRLYHNEDKTIITPLKSEFTYTEMKKFLETQMQTKIDDLSTEEDESIKEFEDLDKDSFDKQDEKEDKEDENEDKLKKNKNVTDNVRKDAKSEL